MKKLLIGYSLLAVTTLMSNMASGQDHDLGSRTSQFYVDSSPRGVVVTIDGEYRITGRTPFYLPFPISGKYAVQAVKEGYESWGADVVLTDTDEKTMMIKLKRRTRAKAALRSFVFPGWGHFYSKRKAGGILFTTVIAGAGAYALFTQLDYKDEVDKFNDLKDQLRTLSPEKLQELNDQFGKVEDADDRRKRAFIIVGSLWVYNILDAILFFPEFGHIELSKNKQVHISQNFSNDTVKIGLSLEF